MPDWQFVMRVFLETPGYNYQAGSEYELRPYINGAAVVVNADQALMRIRVETTRDVLVSATNHPEETGGIAT